MLTHPLGWLFLIDGQPDILAGIPRLLEGKHPRCPLQAIPHDEHLAGWIRMFQRGGEFKPGHALLPSIFSCEIGVLRRNMR